MLRPILYDLFPSLRPRRYRRELYDRAGYYPSQSQALIDTEWGSRDAEQKILDLDTKFPPNWR